MSQVGSRVPHQYSSFLESEGKKVDVVTTGSPCFLSSFHVCFIFRRSCLVGVKRFASSSPSWDLQESCILVSVSGVGPSKVIPCSVHDGPSHFG